MSGAETAAPVRALFLFPCFAGKNQKDQLASSDQRKGLIYFVDEQKQEIWLLTLYAKSGQTKDELLADWELALAGEEPFRIAPLQFSS